MLTWTSRPVIAAKNVPEGEKTKSDSDWVTSILSSLSMLTIPFAVNSCASTSSASAT